VNKKAVSIEIRWDDGSLSRAEGKQAADIWDWFASGETTNIIHGAVYRGEKFTEIPGLPE